MQDTMAGKRLPRWLICLAETPGSQIENLNRAERLGVIDSVDAWLETRQLRNRLAHEYMDDAAAFARDLLLANVYCLNLFGVCNGMRAYAAERTAFAGDELPAGN